MRSFVFLDISGQPSSKVYHCPRLWPSLLHPHPSVLAPSCVFYRHRLRLGFRSLFQIFYVSASVALSLSEHALSLSKYSPFSLQALFFLSRSVTLSGPSIGLSLCLPASPSFTAYSHPLFPVYLHALFSLFTRIPFPHCLLVFPFLFAKGFACQAPEYILPTFSLVQSTHLPAVHTHLMPPP